MTLEDKLQGEWLCCIGDQRLDEAWSIDVRGRQCNIEGTIVRMNFIGDEAHIDLGDGASFVINRRGLRGSPSDGAIPVVMENTKAQPQAGWMFRPALSASTVRAEL